MKFPIPPGLRRQLHDIGDIVDPPRRGIVRGAPGPAAELERQIPHGYLRAHGTVPVGYTVDLYPEDEAGDSEIPEGIARKMAADGACPPGIRMILTGVLPPDQDALAADIRRG